MEGMSSVTYPGRRTSPWPSIKATISSLSDSRLSVPIVKQSFSQMALGQDHRNVESSSACETQRALYRGLPCNLELEVHLPVFKHHVFVCHNTRPEGAPRPSCTTDGKSELHTQLQQISKAAGLGNTVRINKSGCLDQCEHGPTVVVFFVV